MTPPAQLSSEGDNSERLARSAERVLKRVFIRIFFLKNNNNNSPAKQDTRKTQNMKLANSKSKHKKNHYKIARYIILHSASVACYQPKSLESKSTSSGLQLNTNEVASGRARAFRFNEDKNLSLHLTRRKKTKKTLHLLPAASWHVPEGLWG